MTFTEIGAFVGFLTGLFVLFDRLLSGRPQVSLVKSADVSHRARDLECLNSSKQPILVTRVRCTTRLVRIWRDQTDRARTEAVMGEPFSVFLGSGQSAAFPIVVSDGTLLDEGAARVPFLIIVSWRKTSSMWLPQFPVVRLSSVHALRKIDNARVAKR
jgi:hypothetical protein